MQEEYLENLSLLNNSFARCLNNGMQYLVHSKHLVDNNWRLMVSDCSTLEIWEAEFSFADVIKAKDIVMGKCPDDSWQLFFRGLKDAFSNGAVAINITDAKSLTLTAWADPTSTSSSSSRQLSYSFKLRHISDKSKATEFLGNSVFELLTFVDRVKELEAQVRSLQDNKRQPFHSYLSSFDDGNDFKTGTTTTTTTTTSDDRDVKVPGIGSPSGVPSANFVKTKLGGGKRKIPTGSLLNPRAKRFIAKGAKIG